MRRAVVVALTASLHAVARAATSPSDEARAFPQEASLQDLDDACEAGAESEACSLSMRQLRGEARTAVVNRHMDLAKFEAFAQNDTMASSARSCAANQKCYDLGMTTGVCCPTPDGTMLGCCDSIQTSTTTAAPPNGTSCSEFQACTALGITEGACCPTSDGTMLGCCSSTPVDPNHTILEPQPGSQCSRYDGCVAANLTIGYCCPTVTGHVLDCCGDLRADGDDISSPAEAAPVAAAPPAPAGVPAAAPPAPAPLEEAGDFPPSPPSLDPVPRPSVSSYDPPPGPKPPAVYVPPPAPRPTSVYVPPPAPVPVLPPRVIPAAPAGPPPTTPCVNQLMASIGFVNCGGCTCVHYTTCPVCTYTYGMVR